MVVFFRLQIFQLVNFVHVFGFLQLAVPKASQETTHLDFNSLMWVLEELEKFIDGSVVADDVVANFVAVILDCSTLVFGGPT